MEHPYQREVAKLRSNKALHNNSALFIIHILRYSEKGMKFLVGFVTELRYE